MTAPARFRLREVLQATVAAVGVAILLIGVPILLWTVAHTLHYPTGADWFHLDQNIQAPPVSEQFSNWLYHTYHALRLGLGTDGVVLVVLLVVAGLAWLGLVWLTLVELVLLARDGAELLVDRARQAGPRGWIASLLATFALSTTANAADAAPAPTTAATAPPQPGTPEHAGEHPDSAFETTLGGHDDPPPTSPTTHLPDELRTDCPRYRVHAGDTLIRIAAQHLGDAAQWRELAELNQPWLANPNQLAPGWQLLLPPDAPAPDQPEVTEITVAAGDTLAGLAEHHLGTPERVGELYNLNASRTQPDGLQLADPDIVLPGWILLVPTDVQETVPEQDPPWAGSPEEPAAGSSSKPDAVPPASGTNHGGIWAGQGAFLGLGLASAISLALAVARARHRRHYRPGDDLPDLALAPTVLALRWAHLRASHARDTADKRSSSDTSVVPPAVSPDADDGDHAAASTRLRLDVGVHDKHTSTIDLAAQAGLALTGPASEPVARALLLHLLTRHSSSTIAPVQIVLTRPEAELLLGTSENPPTTVRILDELPTALDLLEHARHDPHTEPQEHDAPLVLLTRAPTEHAHRLHRLLHAPTARTLAAILLGPWPEGTTLSTDADAHVTHTHPDTAEELQGTRLFTATPAAARDLLPLTPTPATQEPSSEAHLDTVDTAPQQQAGYATPLHTPATEPAAQREPTAPAVDVTLRVFGPISVVCTDNDGHSHDLTPSLTSRQRELLAYLAIHPDGVSRDTLITDLWHEPTRNRPTNALNTLLSRLRNTLWQASCGVVDDLIEVDTAGHHRYRLDPQLVTTDYAHFQQLDSTSHHSSDTDQRLTALDELVATYTGPLAADIDTEWIQAPRYQAQRSFINAISTLARHRHTESPQHTLDLLESALRHDPYNESLYRDIMRLQHQLGMPHSISHTLHSLTTRLADIDAEPTSETTTLAHQLRQHDPPHHPYSLPIE